MATQPPDTRSSVIPQQAELFKRISERGWWDDRSTISLLAMNKLRVPLVKDGLIKTGIIDSNDVNTKKPFQNLLLLDVGCGGGFLSEALAKLGGTIHGIDPVEALINVAEAHARVDESLTNLFYFNTTVEDHAVKNFEKYDAVILSEVIEHVTQKDMLLEACVKCLKPGGSIFITTINKTMAAWIISIIITQEILNIIPRGAHTWDELISPEDVTTLLKKYNCNTVEVKGAFHNIITDSWYWCSNTSIYYTLQAVKCNNL